MARVVTAGAELQGFDGSVGSTAGIDGVVASSGAGNAVTYNTTVKRSGAASYKCLVGATAGTAEITFPFAGTQGVPSFSRAYVNVPSSVGWPSSGGILGKTARSTTAVVEVRVSSTGVATLWASNVQVGTGSYQLALDTWHRIEIKCMIPAAGNGTLALQIDGASVVPDTSVSVGTSVTTMVAFWGANGANATTITNYTVNVDDVAINNSSGVSQNSYPGAGSVVLLKPASDNARTNWTTDALGTTNLWDGVNATPPVGIADTTTGSGLHQIRDPVASTLDNYDANLQTYSAAGVPAGSTVTLVQACANIAAASSTSIPNVAIFLVSNAGGTTEGAETITIPSGVAGTWPSGWATRVNTTLIMAAQPTLASAPVLRMGKRTGSTRIAMCCFMGLIVEYVPPAATLLPGQRGRHLAARSSSPARGRF